LENLKWIKGSNRALFKIRLISRKYISII
jgi:hypothetical protein